MITPLRALAAATALTACSAKDHPRCANGAGLDGTPIVPVLPDKTLALTFDDGPGPETDPLAAYLAEAGAPSTFFVVGRLAQTRPEDMKGLRSRGHLVANHTHTHQSLTAAHDPVGEVMRADEVISAYVTGDVFLFRAPYGAFNTNTAARLNASRLGKYTGPIDWDIGDELTDQSGSDWACYLAGIAPDACAERYLTEIRAKGRGVVLLHDTVPGALPLVRALVPQLKAEGYAFVRLDAAQEVAVRVRERGGKPGDAGDSCYDY